MTHAHHINHTVDTNPVQPLVLLTFESPHTSG